MIRHRLQRALTSASTLRAYSAQNKNPKILITGALGQLGTGLAKELRKKYGNSNVIASDIKKAPSQFLEKGPYEYLNVLNKESVEALIVKNDINWVIHFSALLSAVAEQQPHKALELNMNSFQYVLELGKKYGLRIFMPSTIGAFGPTTPKQNTPDLTVMRPNTIYGITKIHCELLDYAVDIFHQAVQNNPFTCFLKPDTILPMMYCNLFPINCVVPDCIDGTVQFLETDPQLLKKRIYNLAAFSFSPQQLYEKIQVHFPEFHIQYSPDFRQQIADSWPASLDDSNARQDWNWSNRYNLDQMVEDMLVKLKVQYKSI